MPSRMVLVQGTSVELPERCGTCWSVPTEEDAKRSVSSWDGLAKTCGFCGSPIRLVSGPLEHVHPTYARDYSMAKVEERWAIQNPKWEESVWWSDAGPFGRVEIHSHIPCAKKGMPFANFEKRVFYNDEIPPKIGGIQVVIKEPCDVCGAMSNPQDVQRVIGRLYDVCRGHACVFCGEPLRLRKIVVWHNTWPGEHISDPKRWHFETCEWEPRFHWTYHATGTEILDFTGHLYCARVALRYADWDLPDKKRKRWEPQAR